jgi:asparagine synthase (glutamine-hydrolysing)
MCGIAGVVRRDGSPVGDPAALGVALGGALAHRGPDGSGCWQTGAGDVFFLHRRLAIIDPGPDGAQPMTTADGRHTIVYNGEVYNFRELRRELESRGERFRTSSDTEVLLRLIALDGPAALSRVRGMFALACWDRDDRSLLLARDRFGIKPLYVAADPRVIAFASELGALRAAGLVDRRPSPAGVAAFLAWGSVPPPLTWLGGADTLAPGAWCLWRQDGVERRGVFADARDAYHTAPRTASSEHDWQREVGEAVRDSVRAHLVADVPVGVFLSGGIDSGAIVSAATSAGAPDLQTFTVGVDDASSESERARDVAKMFGTRHHELRVDAAHVVADLPRIFARLDQPTIDGINSYYVSRAVAATGIKAVLSGTGGDELFGGYASFSRLTQALAIKRMAGRLLPLVGSVGNLVAPARLQARWRHFACSNGSLIEAYRVQRGFLLPGELASLAGPALADPAVWAAAIEELERAERERLSPSGPETPAASVARLESRQYLTSQLLRDTDVMAMAHGLEVRVPFVDHVLQSAVWPELGRRPSLLAGKRLLHATLQRPLPAAIVNHPKQGFTLPFARWMRGELAPIVRDGMQRLEHGGWIAGGVAARVWREWESGLVHWSRPWGLGILGQFLDIA